MTFQRILSWFVSLFKKVPHNSFPSKNQGVIEGILPEDWVQGSIPFEVRNASADWRPYLPLDEKQYYPTFDTMACVSFSLTSDLEMQAEKIDAREYNWSDRFLAKMSGTTERGNLLSVVAETVRKYGLVNEFTWPAEPINNRSEYYSPIPTDVIAKGKTEFPFGIAYEWISTDMNTLKYHLQHAPIQITIPGQNPNHAVVLVAIADGRYYYYDSYAPYLKSMSYGPASALKIVLYDNRIVMRRIGWVDQEKGRYVGFDTEERQAKFDAAMKTLFPDYRVEEKEWNLGKRPW
jgi:hypothetical protein